jgi:ATPase subunit of ABC transporter with duplicated ATPase domains
VKVLRERELQIEAGERIAIIGPNGIGKTTLMRCLAGELKPTKGHINWVENASPATCRRIRRPSSPRRPTSSLDVARARRMTSRSCAPRSAACCSPATRRRRSVKVLSGGEKGRMIYGKLMLTRPNVMLMDEPTNHMDMETIESLQIGLEKYRAR